MPRLIEELYEPYVRAAREATEVHPCLQKLLAPDIAPSVLERFLIEYCSLGVQITEPVEGWIRRAGERCKQLGLLDVGDNLIKHAAHEAGHHEMFIADTELLVELWNRHSDAGRLVARKLIDRNFTDGMRRYIDLHERVIASEAPFAQIAIELEVERLSTTILPKLLEQFQRILGRGILEKLSFLTEHAALDVGHTHLNTRMMEQLLALRPEVAERVAQAGAAALDAYMRFFDECLGIAQREASKAAA